MNNGSRYYSRVYIDTSVVPHRLYTEIDLNDTANINGNTPSTRAAEWMMGILSTTDDPNERQSE